MDISPYAILGLDENAAVDAAEAAFNRMSASLDLLKDDDKNGALAQKALAKMTEAIAQIKDQGFTHAPAGGGDLVADTNYTHPRLGQICVASGLISMEQLSEAVEEQIATGAPLGEVLQDKQFLSPIQLEGLLLGQEMIDVPSQCTDPAGRRLIALEIVTEDMVLIAQMEQKSLNQTLVSLLERRGWVNERLTHALEMDRQN
ncbi:MAG TPA: hypothetical protein PKZ32_21035 [Candidatus Melainabacteria bacterium]|nr:hypothetical protein [Candidatus Melainabacteria bacterium]